MLQFKTLADFQPGVLCELLVESYQGLFDSSDVDQNKMKADWQKFDQEVFSHPDTIGKCVFITTLDEHVIGFASFDPRNQPKAATLGHNCILPNFRGQGFGKEQVREVLNQLKARNIQKAIVNTGDHPFFIPAQKMYLSCGFKELHKSQKNHGFPVIKFEKQIFD